MLSTEFRHRDLIAKVRKVRTPEGSRYFNAPIGTPITGAMEVAARIKHGKGMPRAEAQAHAGTGGGASAKRPKAVNDQMRAPKAGPKAPKAAPKALKATGTREERMQQYHAAIDAAHKEGGDHHALVAIVNAAGADKTITRDDLETLFSHIKDPKAKPEAPSPDTKAKAPQVAAQEQKDKTDALVGRPKPGAVAGTQTNGEPPKKKDFDFREHKIPVESDPKGLTPDDFKGNSERAKFLRTVVGHERDIAEAKNRKALDKIESVIQSSDLPEEAKAHLLRRVADKYDAMPSKPSKAKDDKQVVEQPSMALVEGKPTDKPAVVDDVPEGEPSYEAMDNHVAAWEKAISQANSIEGLNRVHAGFLEADERGWLTDDQAERVLTALEDADKRIGDVNEDENTVAHAEPSYLIRDMEGVAAQKEHFAKGGTLADAPDAGLWNHILADKKRFEVKANGSRGIAANFWVTDKKTGEKWMLKRSHFDGVHDPRNLDEHVNELMAADLWKSTGGRQHTVRMASTNQENAPTFLLQRHWGEEMSPDATLLNNQKVLDVTKDPYVDPDTGDKQTYELKKSVVAGIKKGSPEMPLKLMLFDYLINNTADRHGLNVLLSKNKDGSIEMAPIDNGLAFMGGHVGTDKKSGFNLSMDNFLKHYRADQKKNEGGGGWGLSELVMEMNDGDRAKLKKSLQAAIKDFGKSGLVDAVEKRMQDHVHENQREMVTNWLDEYAYRIDWLDKNVDKMVDVISKRGGA